MKQRRLRVLGALLVCAVLSAACTSSPAPVTQGGEPAVEQPPVTATSEVPEVTPPATPTASEVEDTPALGAAQDIAEGDGTCEFERFEHRVQITLADHAGSVACADLAIETTDGDVSETDRSQHPVSVAIERRYLAGWFDELHFKFEWHTSAYEDVAVTSAEYVPTNGRPAWLVDLASSADDQVAVERHFVMFLHNGHLRIVANREASANWAQTLATFDQLVASVNVLDDTEPWKRQLPLQGGQCEVGEFWAYDAPPGWFYSTCGSFNSSSEAELAMQCECWGPLWAHSDPRSVEALLADFDDVTIIDESLGPGALAEHRVVTFDGVVPERYTLAGDRSARVIVADLTSERFVIIANRQPDHVGPGHTWDTTLNQQRAILTSLATTQELTPLRDVPICATGTRISPQPDYRVTGDFDGDGFQDFLHATGSDSYGDAPHLFHFEFGNSGHITAAADPDRSVAIPVEGWQPYSAIRPAGLNHDALEVFIWAPHPQAVSHGIAQIDGCDIVVTDVWGPSYQDGRPGREHCWLRTESGEILRTYLEGQDTIEYFSWDQGVMTPIPPPPQDEC